MPRRLRVHQPGGFYHVTLRGNHQQAIFFTDSDRGLLNKIVARAVEKFGARLHAYCWMSNHLHMLMQVGLEPLSGVMRQIASEYARAIQIKLITTGHFFERRYHASLVSSDSYLMELVRYIHLNPLRAESVRSVSQFPWSSHHVYVGERTEPWVTTDFCLALFGSDRTRAIAAYRKFLAESSHDGWEPTRMATEHSSAVTGDAFSAQIQKEWVPSRTRQTLGELIAEACRRFEIEEVQIASPTRDPHLTKVRAWIAHQATVRHVATRSAVARALGRTESTLRHAIRAYPREVE